MVRAETVSVRFALVLLAFVLMPAVSYAVAENEADGDKHAQSEADSRSYLPPWMQNEGKEPRTEAVAAKNGAVAEATDPVEDAEAKKKAKQKMQRRPRSDFSFFPSLFGR